MNPSQKCIDLVKSFEGLRHAAYKCPAGIWTIGYGTTSGVKPGDVVSSMEAERLLAGDLAKAARAVSRRVAVDINQNQFDALCSFTYNVGRLALAGSTLIRLLNQGNYPGAADQFLRWDKADGATLPGLTRRRQAERELFLSEAE